MNASLTSNADVKAVVSSKATLSIDIYSTPVLAHVSTGSVVVEHVDLPDYDGEYAITPSVAAQTLETANKTLREDIEINPIPYYDVSNEFGRTIYIGGE